MLRHRQDVESMYLIHINLSCDTDIYIYIHTHTHKIFNVKIYSHLRALSLSKTIKRDLVLHLIHELLNTVKKT